MKDHLKIVREAWGEFICDISVLKGLPGLDGSDPAYRLSAQISFESMANVQKALQSPMMPEMINDLSNYTDTPGQMHVGER